MYGKPLIDAKDEVRELTTDDLRAFAPARKVLRESLKRKVVQRFRATGDGWQTRVDVALQDWLKKHPPAA